MSALFAGLILCLNNTGERPSCAKPKSEGKNTMPEEQVQNRWLTKADLAFHYSISLRTVTNLMRRRVLPYVQIGRVVRFDTRACEQAMRKFEVVSVG